MRAPSTRYWAFYNSLQQNRNGKNVPRCSILWFYLQEMFTTKQHGLSLAADAHYKLEYYVHGDYDTENVRPTNLQFHASCLTFFLCMYLFLCIMCTQHILVLVYTHLLHVISFITFTLHTPLKYCRNSRWRGWYPLRTKPKKKETLSYSLDILAKRKYAIQMLTKIIIKSLFSAQRLIQKKII